MNGHESPGLENSRRELVSQKKNSSERVVLWREDRAETYVTGEQACCPDPVPSPLSLQGPSEASSTDFILMRPKGNDKSTKYTEQTLKLQIRPLPLPPPPQKDKGLTGARRISRRGASGTTKGKSLLAYQAWGGGVIKDRVDAYGCPCGSQAQASSSWKLFLEEKQQGHP